ncbi:hybrid sensor histidine kinase/response regulator transcription factor [Spirosoma oryzicola]|uniref:hybrid sensor histidine kinase/response regulator transcription factor n=1 Tax=Spirosoma oryzicola TaxID=2898794 RepID=UPI001E5A3A91|nr:two-component regulator propeller domain-containing protein [Spirosoma oryzicola]UHG93149.1 ATP-binding protein [Spirosoma oryzicola]
MSPVVAQSTTVRFNHLSSKDGLSHNSVNCILQDRDGFMWFGTNEGLNKYDGYAFTVVQPDSAAQLTSLHSSRIAGLCEDRHGRLWAATEGGGLYEVDKKRGRMTQHPIRTQNAHRWNNQLSVYEDSQGFLWLSTYNGLVRYDPSAQRFRLYPTPQRDMPIKSVFEDPQHRLWVGTLKGLYQFDRAMGRYTLLSYMTKTGNEPVFNSFHLDKNQTLWLGTAGDGIFQLDLRRPSLQLVPYNPGGNLNRYVCLNTVQADAQGLIWIGTTNGLQRIHPTLHQITTLRPQGDQPNGLSSANVQAVYIDRSGTIWVGTDNGIDEQASNRKAFTTYQVKPSLGTANLLDNKVNTLLIDPKNQLWLSNQFSVYRIDASRKHASVVPPQTLGSTAQHTNYYFSLLPDGTTGMWLGTWDGLYHYSQTTGRFTAYPSEVPGQLLSRAPDGKIWLGGEGGIASFDPGTRQYTYYKYDPANPTGLSDKFVYALLASRTGAIWVGINGKGISRLDPTTSRFTHFSAGTKPNQLNSNEILTFYEDRQGIIWSGTNQSGLNRFDPQTGHFSSITTENGLPSNRVVAITGDNAGFLWLSTNKGLCRYDPRTKTVRTYDSNAGLPSNEFLENAVFNEGNRVYFGSLNGLVSFNPDSIQANDKSFPVTITDFKVKNQSRPLLDTLIQLDHDENFLSFEFAALTYTLPQQSQYAYQLVGIDKTWIPSGTRHFANYTNLSPGDYTFRVKAASNDGLWSANNAVVHLRIQSPWWATYWAYGFYLLAFGGMIWAYLRFQTDRIRQRQEIALRRSEAEQLQAVNEIKNRFFANITHEFRTPLSLIISPVEKLIQESAVNPSTRQTLSLVNRNAQHLLRLINQLMDLAKLEAASMPVTLMHGELDDFVQQLVDSFGPAAEHKAIALTYTSELSSSRQQFDADKWEKIIVNLLSNAVKFTPSGGRITISLKPLDGVITDEKTTLQLVVSDTGTGIPAESLHHVFDRFYQVDSSHTRAYEGTGIGLALVKELIELMGGTIAVDSQVGVGTTFTILLPVELATTEEGIVSPRPSTPIHSVSDLLPDLIPGSSGVMPDTASVDVSSAPLLLLVEDNHDLREFMAAELATAYRVMSAPNGQEGWQLVQAELPDVVISDVMMPLMDGYELTRNIKSHPETDHIAVLLLTAKSSHPSRLEGLQEGADDYLNKPFNLDELRLRLRNLISRQQKLSEQYRQQLAQPDAPTLPEDTKNPFLDQIYALLEEHLGLSDSTLTVDWLAENMAMSRKTLYRKLGSLTDLAPNELIRNYRLRKAVDLLRAGHSASETAYLVGFKTPSHFTTVFKEYYKKTPSDFLSN